MKCLLQLQDVSCKFDATRTAGHLKGVDALLQLKAARRAEKERGEKLLDGLEKLRVIEKKDTSYSGKTIFGLSDSAAVHTIRAHSRGGSRAAKQ